MMSRTVLTIEVALGYTLTIAELSVASQVIARDRNSESNALTEALAASPIARLERAKWHGAGKVTLQRYNKTEYVQWFGQKDDGRWHPFGNVMVLVRVRP
jgi:hypothetical protein